MKNRLTTLREKAGWTPVELANSVGVTRATITAIENGSYDPKPLFSLRHCRTLGRQSDRAISSSAKKSATRRASSKTVVRQAVFGLR
jgi:DNA-binding XRE family transcriptional regulator